MPDSDLEHQTLYFLAQLDTLEPTDAEGDVMGANEDGSELHHTEQNLLRLDLGQSNEEAQVTIALDCSLGRLSGAGIFERSLSGSERLSFLFWGTLGNAVLLVFSLLGTTAPAPEQPLETSPYLEPVTPLLPTRAPELEQVHFWYFFLSYTKLFMT